MMQPLYGGAAARPFVTHHNTLDIDLYLRIAPELYLKRLVVGGLERVYEINRNFRNEGLSTHHNPEFTMLEFYQAYTDYRGLMDFSAELLRQTAIDATGSHGGGVRRAAARFRQPARASACARRSCDSGRATASPTLDRCERSRVAAAAFCTRRTAGEALADIFERVAEAKLIQPTIIYDYPVETSPLSKNKPDDPAFVERFEIYAAGMEIGNAYTELNDPQEQRRRFEMQLGMRERGDEEAHQMDEDYVRALSYGMPPTGGEGIGIDRLTMILTGFEIHPRRDPVPAAAAGRRRSTWSSSMRELRQAVNRASNCSSPRRYLRARRKEAVISVITVISVLGVAAGVMALVIALAVNNGFRNTLQRNLLGAMAHINVVPKEPGDGIENWRDMVARNAQGAARHGGLAGALQPTYSSAGRCSRKGAFLKGIDVDSELALSDTLRHLKAGLASTGCAIPSADPPGIILGSRLAEDIGMRSTRNIERAQPAGRADADRDRGR